MPPSTSPAAGIPPGRLLLVPNTLDFGTEQEVPLEHVLPAAAIARAAGLAHWVVENAKTARAFLKRVDRLVPLATPLQSIAIVELPRPNKAGSKDAGQGGGRGPGGDRPLDLKHLLGPLRSGHDLGLLSEAGLPAVADPGAALVQAAQAAGLVVEPLAGPSALLLALAASGLNGQSFAFVGYLPVEPIGRATRIRELEGVSRRLRQTQIAIETPYRNTALLAALAEQLQPRTRLAVACGLSLPQGWCRTLTARQWRELALTMPDKLPAVFCWLAD